MVCVLASLTCEYRESDRAVELNRDRRNTKPATGTQRTPTVIDVIVE